MKRMAKPPGRGNVVLEDAPIPGTRLRRSQLQSLSLSPSAMLFCPMVQTHTTVLSAGELVCT